MFEELLKNPDAAGQIIGAVIGVIGLFIGTFISIIITLIMRSLDIKREKRSEQTMLKRQKKEKEFNLKQEIYSHFISELATLENLISKQGISSNNPDNFEKFDYEWTKIEIKVDLIANQKVYDLKEKMQEELFELARKKFASKENIKLQLSSDYMSARQKLLEAIREDMGIFQK